MGRFLRNLIFVVLAIYLGIVGYYTAFQRSYFYHPNHSYVSPSDASAPDSMTELSVETSDGISLKGWYSPATSKNGTIVFFHGNADHLQNALLIAAPYIDAGYGFLIAEYRGYSLMPGSPSEEGLYYDARAYILKLFDKGIDIDHMVFMGHSLGAAVATQAAKEFHPAALVLLAPFKSMTDMARIRYDFLPVDLMVFDRFDNQAKLAQMETPLLIAHGTRDTLVPFSHGQFLFDHAKAENKLFQPIEGRNHGDLFDEARSHIMLFIDACFK